MGISHNGYFYLQSHLFSLSKLDHTQFICQMIKFKRPIKFYYKISNTNTTQKKK